MTRPTVPAGICAKHLKKKFPSRRAATQGMERAQQTWRKAVVENSAEKLKLPPITVYRCEATGCWHHSTRVRKRWGTAQRGGKNDRSHRSTR